MALPSPRALGWLWPRIRPYRWHLGAATVGLVLSAAIGLAFPQVVRHLLDAAFVKHDRAMLDRIALLLVGLFSIQAVASFAQTYLLSSTGERVVAQLRQDLFEHLVRLSPAFFAERRTGTGNWLVTVGIVHEKLVKAGKPGSPEAWEQELACLPGSQASKLPGFSNVNCR